MGNLPPITGGILATKMGESRLPFGVVRCPNQGYFPKYVKI
jgi:hypothetical protein